MLSFKIQISAVLCGFLALPFAYTQDVKIQDVVAFKPKWEVGLRSGAGFNLSHSERQVERSGNAYYVRPLPYKEYYLGGYLTRHFKPRFSLRSELSFLSNTYTGSAVTVGLFPRYKLNHWLSLEAGAEATHTLTEKGKNTYRGWLGVALGFEDMEFNLRFSPNHQSASQFGPASWNNLLQAGMSVNLAKLSNRMNRKK